MQFRNFARSFVISLCISAFMASCITVDKEVGDNLIPDNEKVYLNLTDIPLPVTLNQMDDLQGFNTNYLILGNFRTEEFGDAKFSTAANLSSISGTNFGKNIKLYNVRLVVPTKNSQYLNDSQNGLSENIFVYRTNVVLDSTYYYQNSIKAGDYNPEPINAAPAAYFGADTLVVFLKNSFGEELLTATQSQLDSNILFMKRFNGLYIKSEPMIESINGGRIAYLSLASAFVELRVNFTPTWKEGLAAKDTVMRFRFGNGFCVNTSEYSNKYNDLIGNPNLSEIPVEGIAGVKPYIGSTELKKCLDKWAASNNYNPKKIVVNKATIELPFTPPADYDYQNFPTFLYPVYRDTNNYRFFYPIKDIGKEFANGKVNKSLNTFEIDCSSIIQKFFKKTEEELSADGNDIWFTSLIEEVNQYMTETNYYTDSQRYFIGKINGPQAANAPKLKLLYTVISD